MAYAPILMVLLFVVVLWAVFPYDAIGMIGGSPSTDASAFPRSVFSARPALTPQTRWAKSSTEFHYPYDSPWEFYQDPWYLYKEPHLLSKELYYRYSAPNYYTKINRDYLFGTTMRPFALI